MQIIENREKWKQRYEDWLATSQALLSQARFGEAFANYPFVHNRLSPGEAGITLSDTRLMIVTSSGAYIENDQEPFEADNPLGDYTIRTFSANVDLHNVSFAHIHYDHGPVTEDPQVLLPLEHLRRFEAGGIIGSLCPEIVSFMGYLPDACRVVDEVASQVVENVWRNNGQAALLVPA